MNLPLELQLLVIELSPWEAQPTLSLVCRKWRSFILSSRSVLKARYTPYTVPEGNAFGPKTHFDSPLYHGILAYLTHYIRTDDGVYRACYIKDGDLSAKRLLDATFFGKDLLSYTPPSSKKGKQKAVKEDGDLHFNNIYAHERSKPWKHMDMAPYSYPSVAEFLRKNALAVNQCDADYYKNYSDADILKVIMKFNRDDDRNCFLEFALIPLQLCEGHRKQKVIHLDPTSTSRTKRMIQKWEVMSKFKTIMRRRKSNGEDQVKQQMGRMFDEREVPRIFHLPQ